MIDIVFSKRTNTNRAIISRIGELSLIIKKIYHDHNGLKLEKPYIGVGIEGAPLYDLDDINEIAGQLMEFQD